MFFVIFKLFFAPQKSASKSIFFRNTVKLHAVNSRNPDALFLKNDSENFVIHLGKLTFRR